jgi:hypothetical protein
MDWSANKIAEFPPVGTDTVDIRVSQTGDYAAVATQKPVWLRGCVHGVFIAPRGGSWHEIWCGDNSGALPRSVSWSRDGHSLIISAGVALLFLDAAQALKDAPKGGREIGRGDVARWSPVENAFATIDGDYVVIVRGVGTPEESHERHALPVARILPGGLEWSPDGNLLLIVNVGDDQPGDSRALTSVGFFDTQTWLYRSTSATLWGDKPYLRFVSLPPDRIGDLQRIRDGIPMR